MSNVIYPGTFDPITLGHLDVIRRASRMFETLIVAVGDNPAKSALFTRRERLAMVRAETKDLKNVEVHGFGGLLVDFASKQGATTILRGVRTTADFEYELQMAVANRAVGGVETIFMAPTPEYEFVSARLIREIAAMSGDVSRLVPPSVASRLKRKCARARRRR